MLEIAKNEHEIFKTPKWFLFNYYFKSPSEL
ncbi:hypothetical protein SAMN00777080_1465 [Aquiflexum balticum DSM 16537]|uniref:Uncharacterized protein n=1 Tax=Aquiflexum balticum DSM 16537 TaxID=758820 RepID=A0A1W2H1Q6_9BACT|nr:hypothetical protein SAMN00777080_1465 [Aquiflexum balticum DSM 16537]